jgi:hypothetical protein
MNAALRNRDSSVNIVTRIQARQRETVVRFPARVEVLCFLKRRNGLWGRPSHLFSGRQEVKPSVREAVYASPFGVIMAWNLMTHCRGGKNFCDIKIK